MVKVTELVELSVSGKAGMLGALICVGEKVPGGRGKPCCSQIAEQYSVSSRILHFLKSQ